MARLFTSGLETNDFLATEWGGISGPPTIQSGTVHSGTYAMEVNNPTNVSKWARADYASKTTGTLWVRSYIRFATLPNANAKFIDISTGGAGDYLSYVTAGTTWRIGSVGGVTATGTTALSTGVWYRFELRVLLSDTVGEVEGRLYSGDSTTPLETLSLTSQDTLPTSVGQLYIGAFAVNSTCNLFIDDVAINDETGAFQNSWIGPGKTALMKPNSDAAVAWTKAGSTPAASNWAGVDDVPGVPNDGVDFNRDNQTTNVDRMGLTGLPVEVPSNATMKLLHVYGRVGSDATTARTMICRVWNEGGTSTDGPSINVAINGWKILAAAERQVYDLTGKTKANVDSFNAGYKGNTGANRNKNISALWANVEWLENADVTVALTGVAASAVVGIVSAALALALSGVFGTGSVGAVAPQTSRALTGVASTGIVGAVAPQISVPLAGVAGTGAVGNVTVLSNDVTLPLTGVASTGIVGAVAPQTSLSLTGVAGTGAVGAVSTQTSRALTGVPGTGAVGAVAPQTSRALTGVASTGIVGALAPQASVSLAGVVGTGAVGTVAPQTLVPLTGVAASGAVGTAAPQAAIPLAGVAGTGAVGVVAPQASALLAGVAGTGAVGNLTPLSDDVMLPLTGVAATGSVGVFAPQTSILLTGVASTVTVGELTAGVLRPAGMRPGAAPGIVRRATALRSRSPDSTDSIRPSDLPGSARGADMPTSKR